MNDVRDYLSKIGRRGGNARSKKMTPEERSAVAASGGKATAQRRTKAERSEAARKAVEARWAKLRKQSVETKAVIDEGTKKLKKLVAQQERNRKKRAKQPVK